MGNRLSKIYTRTGDDGSTGLGDGSRVEKDSARVEAYGTTDELNSAIGVLLAHELTPELRDILTRIQHDLFDLGGELCVPGFDKFTSADSARLEKWLDELNLELPALKEFILPAGGLATTACHMARTICRRAERRMVTLARTETVNPHALAYINRLSDLLFVVARVLVRQEHGEEVLWQRQKESKTI